MKKVLSIIAICLIVLMFPILLVGCGQKNTSPVPTEPLTIQAQKVKIIDGTVYALDNTQTHFYSYHCEDCNKSHTQQSLWYLAEIIVELKDETAKVSMKYEVSVRNGNYYNSFAICPEKFWDTIIHTDSQLEVIYLLFSNIIIYEK